MRRLVLFAAAVVILAVFVFAQSRSALESDPQGWKNLLSDKSLKGWVRGPLGPAGQLRAGEMNDANPFKLDASGEILLVEGDRVGHEWLRWNEELGDYISHTEWRFVKTEGEPPYNSGVFARTSTDGKIWHQAQATMGGGYLFANSMVGGEPKRVNLREKMTANKIKPAGEWNTYEIRAQGSTISLWVNGETVNEFTNCEVLKGYFGVEAEGYRAEFRNIQLKKLP
jgi:hypothetical protein